MRTKIVTTALALVISCTIAFAQNKTKSIEKPKSSTKTEISKDSVYYTCPMHHEVKMDKPGKCPVCGMALEKKILKKTETKIEKKVALKSYTCSMHPEVKSDKPGACPKCGMDLIEKK